MKTRLNQRIIQALGRCNRSDEDFGVYILADRRFATHFGRETNRAGIPRNIVAEIDMAQDMGEIEEDELVRKVENFLRGNFSQYDSDLQSYLTNVPSTAPPQHLILQLMRSLAGRLYSQVKITRSRQTALKDVGRLPGVRI